MEFWQSKRDGARRGIVEIVELPNEVINLTH